MDEKELSHAEVWDDSTLLSSWNDALDEYKVSLQTPTIHDPRANVQQKYHSLAAKGEKAEISIEDAQSMQPGAGQAESPVSQVDNPKKKTRAPVTKTKATEADSFRGEETATTVPAPAATLPAAMLNGVQDENLKNLMMSWYYAGYYTGLYEGKQQAFETMQSTE
nr:survival motor neuron-like protein 1 [Quercus suber]